MGDNYQAHITINNRTAAHLIFEKSELPWGVLRDAPVKDIPPKTEVKAFVATGTPGLPPGTEGTVTYRFQDDANITIKIYWDVPSMPLSSNTLNVTTSNQDIAATRDGFSGKGPVESCTIKIVDGR